MQHLKNMSSDTLDDIRIRIGNSYLNLNIRKFHSIFTNQYDILNSITNNKYSEYVKIFVSAATYSLKNMDTGFYLSRYAEFYNNFNKENKNYHKITWYKFNQFLNILESMNFIENYSGFKDIENNVQMSSCVVFTQKLINLFPENDIAKYAYKVDNKKSVIVRKEEKDLNSDSYITTEIKNVQGIGKLKQEVEEIEKWLNTHKFRFITHEKKIDLQRIFSERLDNGGRFYFGGLQCIKSNKRKLYEIDGLDCAELDYSSNHMFIIAEMKQIYLPPDFEPYNINTESLIECDNKDKIRSILKMCCMFLLNSGTPEATFSKFWKKNINIINNYIKNGNFKAAENNLFYGVSGLKNTKKIIQKLEYHNSYAKSHFRIPGGVWGEMQYLDSCIMLNIMKKMMKIDAPFLPYHDSILTPTIYSESLENFMYEAWAEVLGSNTFCKIKRKF